VAIVQFTINELGLNENDCKDVREEYAEEHWEDQTDTSWGRLVKRCPFVAREMDRQGRKEGPP
jgi:hypothetical protein